MSDPPRAAHALRADASGAVGRLRRRRARRDRRRAVVLIGAGFLVGGCALAGGGRAAALHATRPCDLPVAEDVVLTTASAAAQSGRIVELGRSVQGAPLLLAIFGDGPERVLVVAGTHGDEPTGAAVAAALAQHMAARPEVVAGLTVGVLAAANPDGLRAGTRANARGVDVNRNFPSSDWRAARLGELSHGRMPASEPETRAVMRAVELVRPCRIVDVHAIARGWHCNNYDGPARELAELMSRANGYPVRASIGYPTPGALGNWAGTDRGIPTITLEVPGDLNGAEGWLENAPALLAFIAGQRGAGGEPAVVSARHAAAK